MPLLVIWWLLIVYWIFAIYSVSIYESFSLTLKFVNNGVMTDPTNYFYFQKQLLSLLIWIVAWIGVYFMPLRLIKDNRNKIVIFFFLIQLLVFTPLGIELNWSRWWIYLTWFGTFQPSEFFKLAFVIFLAWWLIKKKKVLSNIQWFMAFLVVTWLLFFVYLLLPDLGTLLVLWLVSLTLYWYAWGKFTYVLWLLMIGLTLGLTIWMQFSYIKERLVYFVDDAADASGRGVGWQIRQWLIAIGWGGFLWNGYGKWLQKFWYIPESQSDFIFAAFSEEVWLLWNSVLLALYFALAYIFLKKVNEVKNEYYKMMWVWIICLIMLQVFVNIWVNIKILPLTWLTLPFISYGWTALMINIIELVLLHKIILNKEP